MRALVIISAVVNACDLLPQIYLEHGTYTIGTASFMRILPCSLDQDVATFMVGHFFMIYPTCLPLCVCAGTAGGQNPGKCARMRGNNGA
jgi:hypothetical protein